MGQNNLLDVFFEESTRVFQLRELSRITKIPKTTLSRRLKELIKEKLIIQNIEEIKGYVANEDYSLFRIKKKLNSLEKIYGVELIDYLQELFHPRCIILFGSFSKGEYTKESDIDIFVESKEKKYDLKKFEKKLNHTINLFFDEDIKNLSRELYNNIINGIKLSGYIKPR